MSVWIKTSDKMSPKDEEVLILYKDKRDELKEENLYYGVAKWIEHYCYHYETWSQFTEYQGYYEVVYWTPLVDMPRLNN